MNRAMGGIKPIGVCSIDHRSGTKKENWPFYLQRGLFVLTTPCKSPRGTRDFSAPFFVVTHIPTGKCAGTIMVDDKQKAKKLERYAAIFGNAQTVSGVMRKYHALPPKTRGWISKALDRIQTRTISGVTQGLEDLTGTG